MNVQEITAEIIVLMRSQNKDQVNDQWLKENFTNLSNEDCDEIAKHMKNINGIKIDRHFGGESRFVIDIANLKDGQDDSNC